MVQRRKSATGPEVKGNPTSQPPTAGPQRRPARVAAPISAGVTMSFRTRLGIAGPLGSDYSPAWKISTGNSACTGSSTAGSGLVFRRRRGAVPA
jgi:hypothetical protein